MENNQHCECDATRYLIEYNYLFKGFNDDENVFTMLCECMRVCAFMLLNIKDIS